MTHVERVKIELELSDKSLYQRTIWQPPPVGDNPKFLQKQFDIAEEEIANDFRLILNGIYGRQE